MSNWKSLHDNSMTSQQTWDILNTLETGKKYTFRTGGKVFDAIVIQNKDTGQKSVQYSGTIYRGDWQIKL